MSFGRLLGKVGHFFTSDGVEDLPALGRRRQFKVIQSDGRFFDAVDRGVMFCGGTAASGVAPGTSIGTTAAASLYNPLGSGFKAVVYRVSLGYVSGTLGAGVIHYVANTNPKAAATTGTAVTGVNCKFGGAASVCQALTTATLPATPTVLRPFASLGASLASTAVQPWQIWDDVDGEFVVMPGCTLSLEATAAAGSTPLVVYGWTWAEEPLGNG